MRNRHSELRKQYDNLIEETIRQLESEDQPDEVSLGEDQKYELSYLRAKRHHFRRIWNYIPERSDLSVLDIGTTPFTFILNELMESGNVATIDYTDLMKSRCDRAGITHMNHDLNEGTIPFDNEEFDIVIFTSVLEHLFTPPVPLIKDIARTLSPGGRLIVGTPNFATLWNRMKLLIGKNPQEYIEREHVHGRGHAREYTLAECQEIVEEAELTVKLSECVHPTPMKERIRNAVEQTEVSGLSTPLGSLAIINYYMLTALIPNLRSYIYVVATK